MPVNQEPGLGKVQFALDSPQNLVADPAVVAQPDRSSALHSNSLPKEGQKTLALRNRPLVRGRLPP